MQSSTTPPVAATVFLGANDAALPGRTWERLHVPLEEYKENLRKIVRHLKVYPIQCFIISNFSQFLRVSINVGMLPHHANCAYNSPAN